MKRGLSCSVFVAMLTAHAATAQVMQFRTPAPEVTAASSRWQILNEPIVVSGLLYNATREMRMFDGQVMTQIDVYEGVPIYADTTREPFTVVYVPISRDRLRTYERARDLEMAGPSGRGATPLSAAAIAAAPPPVESAAVGTAGTIDTVRARRTVVETILRPSGTSGVWLEFNGARWYNDGAAVPHSQARFTRIGDHRGFAVYRDRAGNSNRIWVEVVKDGPLAPFAKR